MVLCGIMSLVNGRYDSSTNNRTVVSLIIYLAFDPIGRLGLEMCSSASDRLMHTGTSEPWHAGAHNTGEMTLTHNPFPARTRSFLEPKPAICSFTYAT